MRTPRSGALAPAALSGNCRKSRRQGLRGRGAFGSGAACTVQPISSFAGTVTMTQASIGTGWSGSVNRFETVTGVAALAATLLRVRPGECHHLGPGGEGREFSAHDAVLVQERAIEAAGALTAHLTSCLNIPDWRAP